ncbi:PLP-dependent aminotransferase family protein [Streptosporangium carneum]|uniref:GntR family transcriptional regulator n=1 Tax=Streptosporangium carneum TaxID=47481 RepID=A0A9W6I3G8_9ACTN|nr:PLP-dependent aminotransferase family protein [Streptosporangium carneum]GLK10559.1 GntR family transcriptional regulator [Streptosporangium carneum]
MDLHVSLGGPGDLAFRIHRQLRDAILDGRLRPGERLPSTRELARRLDVARNTVCVAYERLTAEGFLVARVGAGTFVGAPPVARAGPRTAPPGHDVRPRPFWDSVAPGLPAGTPPVHDFRIGRPDGELFPLATWRRLVAGELRASTVGSAGYGDSAGHEGLREAVARHVGISRSVRARAEDVLVTQGAQQALDLVGRILIEPGDCVAVEEPGYPPARALFGSFGARVAGVPVDEEGLDVSALPDAARLVYVTPSHQFPLGTPMSPTRRAALLEWASRRGAVIVEDDYDSEFRFCDRPLEPLQSLDRDGRVVYVGTFSKTLLPMLRLGFLVAPASLQPALRAARRLTDWHGDHVAQAALARFIDSGELSRHVRRATRVYAARRERVLTTLRDDLADWLDPVPSVAGLHLCALFRPDVSVDLDRARELGVAVESLAAYRADDATPSGLVIGYGAVRAEQVADGLRLLARCFESRGGGSAASLRREPVREGPAALKAAPRRPRRPDRA